MVEVRLLSGALQYVRVDPMTTLAEIKLELQEFDPWWHRLSGLRYDPPDDRVRVGSLTMTNYLSLAVVMRWRGGGRVSRPRGQKRNPRIMNSPRRRELHPPG